VDAGCVDVDLKWVVGGSEGRGLRILDVLSGSVMLMVSFDQALGFVWSVRCVGHAGVT
jgi:hypothetical protein